MDLRQMEYLVALADEEQFTRAAALTGVSQSGLSASIRALVKKATAADDFDSRPLLDWFIGEQVEEEATVREIVGRLKLIDNDGPGLLRLDDELGQRPASTTEPAGGQ